MPTRVVMHARHWQVELSQGGLPWRDVQADADKDVVLVRKQAALDDPHTMAVPGDALPGTVEQATSMPG